MVARLAALVAIPSVADRSDDLRHAARIWKRLVCDAGLETEPWPVGDGTPCVVGPAPARDDRDQPPIRVLLCGHYDVQPAGDLRAWADDPLEPRVRPARLQISSKGSPGRMATTTRC